MFGLQKLCSEPVLSFLDTKEPLKGFKQGSGRIRLVLCRGHRGCTRQREGREGPAGRLAPSCGWEMPVAQEMKVVVKI